MPTYKPNRMNTCSGYFADKDGEAGFEYFHERSGERVVLIFATKHIQLPKEMRVLNENKVNWVKAGAGLPNIVPRDEIVLMPELDVDQSKLIGVAISEDIKVAEKGIYLRKVKSTKHKRELWISDEHARLLLTAMAENPDMEIFADKGKVAGFYLIGESEKIYAYLPEWVKDQTDWTEEMDGVAIPSGKKVNFAKVKTPGSGDDDEL